MKKVLILHTAVGLGHKTIAENIGRSLTEAGFEVKLADIGAVQGGKFEKVVVGIHQFINKRLPFVWGFIYRFGHYPILPFRITIAGFNYKNAKSLIDKYQPDIVITTQTAASAVIAYLKKKGFYQKLFGIAFSDYHLHPYWLYDRADFYLANITEQKQRMINTGVSADKIFITGFNLSSPLQIDKQAVRAKFNINSHQKVILLGSGSLGIGLDDYLLTQLSARLNWHTIVVCGNNQIIHKKLLGEYHQPNISIVGFYQPMDELYAIADIFLSKPGGLSTAEALRFYLPMVITSMLPGQEKLNLEYLRSHSLVMPKVKDVLEQINLELDTGAFRLSLQNNPAVKDLLTAPSAAACLTEYLAR